MTSTELEQMVVESKRATTVWNVVTVLGISGTALAAALETLSCPSNGPCTMVGTELVATTVLGGVSLTVMVLGIVAGKRSRRRLFDAQFYLLRETRKR